MTNKKEDLKTEDEQHKNFDFFFNKLAWAAITAIVSFAAIQLNKLTESVSELNKNMTLVVYQLKSVQDENQNFKAEIKEIDKRLNQLERKR